MDDRPYYYRLRGRSLGPVTLRQLRQLAQRAQIGRTTEVSRDGQQWGKAADFPEIFELGGGASAPVDTVTAGGGSDPFDKAPNLPGTTSSNWYYAVNGVQHGPVTMAALQAMVAAGQLSNNDHVFPEGGSDWLPVRSVPQLAGAAGSAPGMAPVINVNVPRQAVIQSEGSNGLAIAGFVLSLLGCSPLALILCLVAMSGRNKANRGLAIAGAIISGIQLLCGCGWFIFVIIAGAANA